MYLALATTAASLAAPVAIFSDRTAPVTFVALPAARLSLGGLWQRLYRRHHFPLRSPRLRCLHGRPLSPRLLEPPLLAQMRREKKISSKVEYCGADELVHGRREHASGTQPTQ